MVSYRLAFGPQVQLNAVLILIVVDNGLVPTAIYTRDGWKY